MVATLGAAMADATQDADVELPPKGIGGWLILPAISTCLSPFFGAKALFDLFDVMSKDGLSKYIPSFQVLLIVELVFNFLVFCGWIYAIVLLFKHRAGYPMLVISLMVGGLVFSAVEMLILFSYFGVELKALETRDLFRGLIATLIWVPYMVVSKRVENTFVN
jgi:hypothetical protein